MQELTLTIRAGKLLSLQRWHLDFERVRDQVDRTGTRQPLKTEKGRRDVVLQLSLARLLREHQLAFAHSQDVD